jgi:hypothetical protein
MKPITDNFRKALDAEFSSILEAEDRSSEAYIIETYKVLLECGLSKIQAMSIISRFRIYGAYRQNSAFTMAVHRAIDIITRISFGSQ